MGLRDLEAGYIVLSDALGVARVLRLTSSIFSFRIHETACVESRRTGWFCLATLTGLPLVSGTGGESWDGQGKEKGNA